MKQLAGDYLRNSPTGEWGGVLHDLADMFANLPDSIGNSAPQRSFGRSNGLPKLPDSDDSLWASYSGTPSSLHSDEEEFKYNARKQDIVTAADFLGSRPLLAGDYVGNLLGTTNASGAQTFHSPEKGTVLKYDIQQPYGWASDYDNEVHALMRLRDSRNFPQIVNYALAPDSIEMSKVPGTQVYNLDEQGFKPKADDLYGLGELMHYMVNRRGVSNPDMHGGNLFYDKDSGQFHVIDFGAAKIMPKNTTNIADIDDLGRNFPSNYRNSRYVNAGFEDALENDVISDYAKNSKFDWRKFLR